MDNLTKREENGRIVIGKVQTDAERIASLETENADLKQKQALMQSALDDLILGGAV